MAEQGWNRNLFCFTLHLFPPPRHTPHPPPPTPSFVGWVFVWYICGQVVSGKPRLLKQGPERTLPKGLALDFCSYDFYWTKPQLLIGLLVWCRQAPRWPFVSAECVIRIPPHIVLPLSFYISYSFWVPVCHFTNLSLGSWLKTEAQFAVCWWSTEQMKTAPRESLSPDCNGAPLHSLLLLILTMILWDGP